MAKALLGYMRAEQQVIRERYAEYDGRRIPCATGVRAYHLDPLRADACCGMTLAACRLFAAKPSMFSSSAWVVIDG